MAIKQTIEEMQRIAEKRSGKCLSDTYISARTKLLWECVEGHQWEATPDNIKRGTWCPICGVKRRAAARKLDIEEMQRIAEERGGKCLSDAYVSAKTKLLWECAEGHQWEAVPSNVKNGTWCPICGEKRRAEARRLGIEEMQIIAEERGGKCLSDTYTNSKTKLLWECAEGHQWEAKPSHIKSGSWCPYCAGVTKQTIEEMQMIAEERGGKCLSDTYTNSKVKLLWECAEGHQWEATPGKIKQGRWCPTCGVKKNAEGRKLDIEEMNQLAEERGGKCLSDTYTNSKAKLLWECAEGHQWEATPSGIKRGHWCPYCAGSAKLTIEEMQRIAGERGGKCLSDIYTNDATKLLWECAEGHQWKAIPNSIRRGTWCPVCSSGLGERICRAFFEQIFGKKFPKSYPKWLVNKKGNQMELDGYSRSLRLAFEHHGEQHYSIIKFFTKSEKGLRRRQGNDELKRELCTLQGIVLIEVPEIPTRLPVEEVKAFMRKECERNGVPLPADFDTKKIDLKNAYFTSGSKAALEELRVIAQERGGKCLSDTYVSAKAKLLWECAEGHRWKTAPTNIKSGTWCPICAGTVKLTIEEMQKIAEERGGKCLSDTYIDNKTKLLWECAEGHKWEAAPSKIKYGKWCPYCAGNEKLTIEEMQKIAKERGGNCLSDTYINNQTKLLWECAEGHQWEARPNDIKRGKWCPECYELKRGK